MGDQEVVNITKKLKKPAIAVLSRSFSTDPSVRDLLAGHPDAKIQEWCTYYFDALMAIALRVGSPVALSRKGEVVAAGVFYAPGQYGVGKAFQTLVLLRFFLRAVVTGMPLKKIQRLISIVSELEARHPKSPHFYVEFVGVKLEEQGSGWGTEIMKEALRRAEKSRVPLYLETSNSRNLPFFKKLGFEIESESTLSGIPYWFLWRRDAE